MCFWLTDFCPIHSGTLGTPHTTLVCPNADKAGYCEKEKTGPGIGFGKYLAPVHRQLWRVVVCGECMEKRTKEGAWPVEDTSTTMEPTFGEWTTASTGVIVDMRAHPPLALPTGMTLGIIPKTSLIAATAM